MNPAAQRVRRAREEVSLSIRELAGRAGVAASTVWRIESGRLDPTVSMFERLLEAHDLVVSKLVAGRSKDFEFCEAAFRAGIVDPTTVAERIRGAEVPGVIRDRLLSWVRRVAT